MQKSQEYDGSEDLNELRSAINEIDDNLLNLLNTRACLVLEVGEIKKERGIPVIRPEREQEVIQLLNAMQSNFNMVCNQLRDAQTVYDKAYTCIEEAEQQKEEERQ